MAEQAAYSEAPEANAVHHRWLRAVEQDIQQEYTRLHAEARSDPQRAGHGGEGTWARILSDWLPPSYEVATRKYIIPEEGNDTFETDLVVFRPSYPRALRAREEVLASGVAAAFSVKLTLNRDGIRDAIERAARTQRGVKVRLGSPREEISPPFPVGLLAHSHTWKSADPGPKLGVQAICVELDKIYAKHPRETLDLLCVANLGVWCASRMPFLPQDTVRHLDPDAASMHSPGSVLTSIIELNSESPTIAVFIAALYERLSLTDPTLRPLADGFKALGDSGGGGGTPRFWGLADVFSENVRIALSQGVTQVTDANWKAFY
ncbi:DUF6602 domain-containing protein [Streptomyces sp. NPDC056949]|uniref:DUF6602 domain-containing protein n=1 Tax=Streptomyces sp. NPDC056949 TaxID=3345976 RepID=UPI00362DC92D